MASTGQAFWYVRTWWRRWTGGKGWHASITCTAGRAVSQSSVVLHDNTNPTTWSTHQCYSGFTLPAVSVFFLFFKLIFPSSSQHVCDCKKGYSVTTSLNKALQRGWLVLSDRAAEINNLEQLSRRGEDASFVRGGAAVCDSRIPGSCRHGGWINTLPPPTTSCEMNILRTFTAVIHYYVLEDK